jgi:hypothetical protein
MCEINLLKFFDDIHQLALLQENSVSETGPVSLSGDPNLLGQSGKMACITGPDPVSETLFFVF